MSDTELDLDLDELSSAEEFLDYFGIEYLSSVVYVNRLHILQRFHDYLAEVQDMPEDDTARFTLYADLLKGAYEDFVKSDAVTEKVFKVFRMHEPQEVFVPLADLRGSAGAS
jgi:nitrogenase-stabilizing/protective protein